MPRDRGRFLRLSARVGSVSDNKIGGWAYRASKARIICLLKQPRWKRE